MTEHDEVKCLKDRVAELEAENEWWRKTMMSIERYLLDYVEDDANFLPVENALDKARAALAASREGKG